MQPLRSSRSQLDLADATQTDACREAAVVTDVEARVIRLVESQVQQSVPSREIDLFQSGLLDSLSLVEILMRLEDEFETRIRLDELELSDFRSVVSIARFLARSGVGK